MRARGVSMETDADLLPLEKTVARMALRASIGNSVNQKNDLAFDDTNILAGVETYKKSCAVCYGIPGGSRTPISKGMFPSPPHLFEQREMVVKDPEGVTYWSLMLLAHADNLPVPVREAFSQ